MDFLVECKISSVYDKRRFAVLTCSCFRKTHTRFYPAKPEAITPPLLPLYKERLGGVTGSRIKSGMTSKENFWFGNAHHKSTSLEE
jgi:hypothetical protein